MNIKMHRLLGAGHFEMLGEARIELSQRMLRSLKEGTGDLEVRNNQLMRCAIDLGAIALILDRPDAEAVTEFRRAADYALALLKSSSTNPSFAR